MPQRLRPRPNRRARLGLSVLLLAVAAAVTSPVAAADRGRLDHPTVLPGQGTTATPFTFTVRYRDGAEIAAQVFVNVGGAWRAMTPTSTTWGSGVVFTLTTTLPAGSLPVSFEARNGSGVVDIASGPTVVVTQVAVPTPSPTPPPTPTPTPTPRPSASPTPTPAPTATPGPTATPSRSPSPTPSSPPSTTTPAPTATATSGTGGGSGAPPVVTPTATPSTRSSPGSSDDPGPSGPTTSADPTAGAGGTPSGSPGRPSGGTASPSGSTASPSAAPSDPSTAPTDGADGGGAAGAGSSGSGVDGGGGTQDPALDALAALGVWGRPKLDLTLSQAFVVSAGGATMAMAFMFFGKRRRDGEPGAPDAVLAADAATAPRQPADAALATTPAPPVDPDLLMPRWRRPSLLQARKADPIRDAVEVVPLSFGAGRAVADGGERRLIRYHVVELLDAPDELRSRPVGSLTHGDEVQLLERSGTYWRVLCPDGREGWVHRMTLGEVVGEDAPPSPVETWSIPPELLARLEPPRAPEPEPALFSAFLAARRADA